MQSLKASILSSTIFQLDNAFWGVQLQSNSGVTPTWLLRDTRRQAQELTPKSLQRKKGNDQLCQEHWCMIGISKQQPLRNLMCNQQPGLQTKTLQHISGIQNLLSAFNQRIKRPAKKYIAPQNRACTRRVCMKCHNFPRYRTCLKLNYYHLKVPKYEEELKVVIECQTIYKEEKYNVLSLIYYLCNQAATKFGI